jgi:hypothetical protein
MQAGFFSEVDFANLSFLREAASQNAARLRFHTSIEFFELVPVCQ